MTTQFEKITDTPVTSETLTPPATLHDLTAWAERNGYDLLILAGNGSRAGTLVYLPPASGNEGVLMRVTGGYARLHPTMKPLALVEKAICNSSKAGDVVYDGFGGSSTTLLACEQTGHRCRMMEVEAHYCDVILSRWEEVTGRRAEKMAQSGGC